MTNITIQLTDEKLSQIQSLAQSQGISPEEYIQSKIETWLMEPPKDFDKATDYVLQKNAGLYQRLA